MTGSDIDSDENHFADEHDHLSHYLPCGGQGVGPHNAAEARYSIERVTSRAERGERLSSTWL